MILETAVRKTTPKLMKRIRCLRLQKKVIPQHWCIIFKNFASKNWFYVLEVLDAFHCFEIISSVEVFKPYEAIP